jgi:hypothetical protein
MVQFQEQVPQQDGEEEQPANEPEPDSANPLLAYVTGQTCDFSVDIRDIMSTKVDRGSDRHVAVLRYNVSQHARSTVGSLMDRGANGGLAGTDVRILEQCGRVADVTGVDDHSVNNLPIVNCAGIVNSTNGLVIVLMNQYAYHAGTSRTIHSAGQIEHYKN